MKGAGMFVSDLDGTLLTSDRRLAAVDVAALAELRRHGVRVVLATGRSEHSLARQLQLLGLAREKASLPIDYLIFSTGAGVSLFSARTPLRSLTLSGAALAGALDLLDRLGIDYMVHRPIPHTAHFLFRRNGGDNPDFTRRLELYADFAQPFSRQALDSFGGATEVVAIVPAAGGHEKAARVAALLNECSVVKATSPLDGESLWIEIFAPTVSKSGAAAWLATRCGIAREEVCAVGNDYNDEDLLSWAGQAYVVGNAPLSLRRRFATVADNDHGGVAEAAARWLAGR